MAQGLSTPDPSLSPTYLSIRRGRATTTHYTHHQVSLRVSRNTTLVSLAGWCRTTLHQSLARVAHWASLWGRPQRWHAKGACATPKKKERTINCWYWTRFVAIIWKCDRGPVFERHCTTDWSLNQQHQHSAVRSTAIASLVRPRGTICLNKFKRWVFKCHLTVRMLWKLLNIIR